MLQQFIFQRIHRNTFNWSAHFNFYLLVVNIATITNMPVLNIFSIIF